MSKLNSLALVCILGGIVLVLFEGISSLMTAGEAVWESHSLMSVFGENAFTWIGGISVSAIQNILNMLVNMQLFILLLGLGVIFLIAGAIGKN